MIALSLRSARPIALSTLMLVCAWLMPDVARSQQSSEPAKADLMARLGEIQGLQGRQRYLDALLKLDELEKDFPKSSDLFNIRGSILLAPSIRNFAAAEEAFKKAAEIEKGGLAPTFNLAELSFVKHDWEESKRQFEAMTKAFPTMQMQVRHLVMFKLLICHLKLGEVDAAEVILAANFTFMDDTPAYYMAKACLEFQKDKEVEAKEWLEKAKLIFGDQHNVAYVDSLMEARWVPNIGLPPVADK